MLRLLNPLPPKLPQNAPSQWFDGLLVSINYEKAFDMIEWDYVLGALQYFNFPLIFIDFVKTMYYDNKHK